jgi:hypothetical protein
MSPGRNMNAALKGSRSSAFSVFALGARPCGVSACGAVRAFARDVTEREPWSIRLLFVNKAAGLRQSLDRLSGASEPLASSTTSREPAILARDSGYQTKLVSTRVRPCR